MNKEIKKLVEQAGAEELGAGSDLYGGPFIGAIRMDFLEKFAELIVQECIQVCQSRVGNRDYNTGRMHCMSDLKEHFGVEE